MSKIISVRLSKSRHEKLTFLYKLYQIETEKDSDRFRELLDKLYSEKTEQLESEEIVEKLPSCPMIPTLITEGKHKGMVFCPNPKIVGLKKGNHVPLGVCLNCWTRQENTREHKGIPTSETTFAPDFESKETEPKKPLQKEKAEYLERARKQRKCVDCGKDITHLEKWKSRCKSCWMKSQNTAWQSDTKPLSGSPMDLRMKEAARIRRANEKMNTKSKEE